MGLAMEQLDGRALQAADAELNQSISKAVEQGAFSPLAALLNERSKRNGGAFTFSSTGDGIAIYAGKEKIADANFGDVPNPRSHIKGEPSHLKTLSSLQGPNANGDHMAARLTAKNLGVYADTILTQIASTTPDYGSARATLGNVMEGIQQRTPGSTLAQVQKR